MRIGRQGMTLIELIIVLAVIAVIGAVVVPSFVFTTDKARLKSDIQSARVIQNAIELYNAEQRTSIGVTDTMAGIIKNLNDKGYLKVSLNDIQCESAKWEYTKATGDYCVVVNITECNDSVKKEAYNQLSTQEAKWVIGGISSAPTSD